MKGYSDEYYRIKEKAETSWPEWKVEEFNEMFAVSKNSKKIKRRKV